MINIKSKNTDFWMDKVINNEQIWEGYFLNKKITEKSKIVYTGFLNEEKGQYKKCSRCGEIKLALPKYFSKNKTSRDGFYSICKACRNK